MASTSVPKLLGVRSAAEQLGVHENTLRRWEQNGLVDAVRLPSGVRRFRADDISALREQMYGPSESHDRAVGAAAQSLRTPAEV
jgi:excisionase family DNA binding protein